MLLSVCFCLAFLNAQESIDGFELVKSGSFVMGSAPDEPGRSPIEKQHPVKISYNYFISRYEVTQKQWEDLMGSTVSAQRNKANPKWKLFGEGPDHPMYYISWYEAIEFCNRMSKANGLTPCYSGSGENIKCNFDASGYRLPTEAEWEYAARGGHLSKGYMYSGSDDVNSVAWQKNTGGDKIYPVGQKDPNELGLFDMSGNVYEWCWDFFEPFTDSSKADPVGAASGEKRVMKGGSWGVGAYNSRSGYRQEFDPAFRSHSVGMRLVTRQEK